MITQEKIKELLSYDPNSGLFSWITTGQGVRVSGLIAGRRRDDGYIRIYIDDRCHLAHRLAFLYMDGSFPPELVDHIDGVKHNNRWVNIRHATPLINMKNKGIYKKNNTKISGVRWENKNNTNPWCAQIGIDGYCHRRRFSSLFEACCWRKSSERRHGYLDNDRR